MEELGQPPFEASTIEKWISRQIKSGEDINAIADELLKSWTQDKLSVAAKKTVGLLCLSCGFRESLANALKSDLKNQHALSWPILWKLTESPKLSREEVTAILTGAATQGQLLPLALSAMETNHSDSRWEKILASEIDELVSSAQKEKQRLLAEIEIYAREQMVAEKREALGKIMRLFPEDGDALKIAGVYRDEELREVLTEIRKHHRQESKWSRRHDDATRMPELDVALKKILPGLDLNAVYDLSIGLSQMGLHENALDTLRSMSGSWGEREKLHELELAINCQFFAEALSLAQAVREEFSTKPDVLHLSIYYEAKALFGLNEKGEAMAVLRRLVDARPDFKDAEYLLQEWETRDG